MAQERVQRKLTTILAADVVGYSRLMEADEEGTLGTLKVYRKVIDQLATKHGGRIFGGAGDSLVAEFGSAVEAVRCAMSMQEDLAVRNAELAEERRMIFRIGINVGDVMVEGDNLFGDGVNVAARLEGLAEPGGICIAASVFEQVRNKLSLGFEDLGPQEVKNISEPVSAYRLIPGSVSVSTGAAAAAKPTGGKRWRLPAITAAAVMVLVVAGLAVWNFTIREPATEAAKLSIVVLPFDNLSGDPEQAYFADAVTEDLINDLSRIRGAFVIARGTSFTYKGKAVNAKDVARELDVRYVLEGSARRAGDQVRVNAQLIDGETGAHIWSERFDREFKNVFALQSDITGRIAAVLRVELLEAESRRPRPANLEAWDYTLRGTVKLNQVPFNAKVALAAKVQFEKAIQLDPDLGMAWEGLAFVHYVAATRVLTGVTVPNSKQLLLEAAQKAVSLDPRRSGAHTVLGLAHLWQRQPDRALASCDTALDLNRNNDDAYICAALAKRALGDPAACVRLFEISHRLNPRHRAWRRNLLMGNCRLLLGEYDKAVIDLKRAKADFPTHQNVNLYLASALALHGRLAEAREILATFANLPDAKWNTIESVRANLGHLSPDWDRVLEGLRRAGMPEQ